MKAVIFAGGTGKRLWPLSRKNSPKQLEKIVCDKSTLQLTVERLIPEFKPKDIFVATGQNYVKVIKNQLTIIPKENIIGEPAKKDVGPAVALMMGYLTKKFPEEPVIILWSDHLIKRDGLFKNILKTAGKIINEEKNKIIFVGQKPRFASENLGWIEFGAKVKQINNLAVYNFKAFKYRPNKELAEKYFSDGRHCWNLGYFVSTPRFVYSLFKQFSPKIYNLTERILTYLNKTSFEVYLSKYYPQMPEVHFDNVILEKLDKRSGYVMAEDIGWSDVGAWEALKEALQKNKADNITHGEVLLENCLDNLIYNYERQKLVVGIDLNDFLVVNTKDVLLVTKKTSVPKIKKLVEKLENTEHQHLT